MSAPAGSGDRVLVVSAGGRTLAVPADEVTEVVASPPITRVPQAPAALRGIANVRGKVTPILALDVLLGGATAGDSGQVIILDREPPVGLAVERVAAMQAAGAGDASLRRLELAPLLEQALIGARGRVALAGSRTETAAPATASAADVAFLQFRLAGQAYALPLEQVREIAAVPAELTALPRSDSVMAGVAPLDGRLLAIVSLRAVLGLPPAERPGAGRVVVAVLGEAAIGLLVDEVSAILRVSQGEVGPVPSMLNRGGGEARIHAMVRTPAGLVSVLATEKVFREETVAEILAEDGGAAREFDVQEVAKAAMEKFVLFRLGDETYGLPVGAVTEIVRLPETITRAPRSPVFVAGLMNHRGDVVPLIDQRNRFGVGGRAEARKQRVIITRLDALTVGFVVDAVERILEAPADALRPAPEMAAADAPIFDRVATLEQDGRLVLLVDPRQLLDQAERDVVRALADRAAPGVA